LSFAKGFKAAEFGQKNRAILAESRILFSPGSTSPIESESVGLNLEQQGTIGLVSVKHAFRPWGRLHKP
jgi:hypothetical protein